MLQGLLNRVSVPLLEEPAPSDEQLENIFQAALRAPDHGRLNPYRFIVIAGEQRQALGELFAERLLALNPEADEKALQNALNMTLRAP